MKRKLKRPENTMDNIDKTILLVISLKNVTPRPPTLTFKTKSLIIRYKYLLGGIVFWMRVPNIQGDHKININIFMYIFT